MAIRSQSREPVDGSHSLGYLHGTPVPYIQHCVMYQKLRLNLASLSLLTTVLVGCSTAPTTSVSSDAADGSAADVPNETLPDATETDPVPEVEPRVIGSVPLVDFNPAPDVVEVELHAAWSEVDIGLEEPLTMMTYNGQFPGPLLEANVGDTVIVDFINGLNEPTTIHWHGLRIPAEMDGNPRIQEPVPPGGTFRYEFVVPDAGFYWYHPHVRAHEQVERGLYGTLIVRDPAEPRLNTERTIVLDDLLLTESGELSSFGTGGMTGMHGRLGNVLVGNGDAGAEPASGEFAATPGSVELWRLVNTSNARTFSVSVDGGAQWRVVGVDGGRVEPYVTDRIQLAVGQRYDLEVVHDSNTSADLIAHVLTLDESENVVEVPLPVYLVNVEGERIDDDPVDWPQPEVIERDVDREIRIELDGQNVNGTVEWTLNGVADGDEPLFTFERGETVRITFENLAGPEHPFHLHGQFFEIVDRGTTETSQPGRKDTVLIPGQSTVEVIAYMDNPGSWMAHCHILEHAELGMMSHFLVLE